MRKIESDSQENPMASNEKHFDALGYVIKSKELGVDEKLAEYQARQLENVINIASHTTTKDIDARDLATKLDLLKTESSLKEDLLKTELSLKEDLLKTESSLKEDLLKTESSLKEDLLKTKNSLKTEIQEVRTELKDFKYESLKFTVWTAISLFFSIFVVLAKGFHWI